MESQWRSSRAIFRAAAILRRSSRVRAWGRCAIGRPPTGSVNAVDNEFPDASMRARDVMRKQQNKVKSIIAAGGYEKLSEVDKQTKEVAVGMKLPGPTAKAIQANVHTWFAEQVAANPQKPPTRKEVDQKIAEQLQHDDSWFGGGYRATATNPATFTPKGAQPYEAYKARAGVTPSPSGGGAPASTPASPGPEAASASVPKDFTDTVTAKFQTIKHRAPTPAELQALYAKHGKKAK